MPSLGADMEAGTLVEWRIAPGQHVHRGDVVALVETEKGIIDIESFEEGLVERLIVQPGSRVPVGTALAVFAGEAAAPQDAGAAPPQPATAAATAATAGRERAPRASPAARAKAVALGIDLASIPDRGPQGFITLQDVERAAGRPGAAPVAPPTAASRGTVRTAIGAAMSRSKREIPHYYLRLAMDFTAAARWLERYNEARAVPERLLSTVLLIKASARAAGAVLGFNGYFGVNGFEPSQAVHVGVAIALRGGGLVAPAILDANQKPLATIMLELHDLVGRVRSGHMRSGELAAATLTVTSLGEEGVDSLYPIIYPPQVAIIGFGSVLERPWAVAGRVEARPVLNLTLAADHRVSDGRQGAQFLARIRDALLRPEEL